VPNSWGDGTFRQRHSPTSPFGEPLDLILELWRRDITFWKKAGAPHITAHTTFSSAIHQRIEGKTYDDHLRAITRHRKAVADLL
jgi:hypothetical protein